MPVLVVIRRLRDGYGHIGVWPFSTMSLLGLELALLGLGLREGIVLYAALHD